MSRALTIFILAGIAAISAAVALSKYKTTQYRVKSPKVEIMYDFKKTEEITFSNNHVTDIERNDGSVSDISFIPNHNKYLAVVDGNIAAFDKNVPIADWRILYRHNGWHINHVYFTSSANGFGIGQNGTIIRTQDSGNSWERIPSTSNFDYVSAEFNEHSLGFIAGERVVNDKSTGMVKRQIEVLKTEDGGSTWVRSFFDDGTSNYLSVYKVKIINENEAILLMGGKVVFKTEDGGKSWAKLELSGIQDAQDIGIASDGKIWIVSNKGDFTSSNDGGETWNQPKNLSNAYANEQWTTIGFAQNGYGLVTSQSGIILFTTNNGESWERIGEIHGESPLRIKIDDKAAIVIGTNKAFKVDFDRSVG